MKSEERQKLKHNELADSLGELPGYIRTYGNRILTVVCVVLILAGGAYFLT